MLGSRCGTGHWAGWYRSTLSTVEANETSISLLTIFALGIWLRSSGAVNACGNSVVTADSK